MWHVRMWHVRIVLQLIRAALKGVNCWNKIPALCCSASLDWSLHLDIRKAGATLHALSCNYILYDRTALLRTEKDSVIFLGFLRIATMK